MATFGVMGGDLVREGKAARKGWRVIEGYHDRGSLCLREVTFLDHFRAFVAGKE
jgi:hypothetical protein